MGECNRGERSRERYKRILNLILIQDRHYLRTSSISPNGKFIACANVNGVKLFSLEYHEVC